MSNALKVIDNRYINQIKTGGFLVPTSLESALKSAEIIGKSTFCPSNFKGKEADIVVALQYAQELDVHPVLMLQNICLINGRICIWGDLVRAICLRQGNISIKETYDEETMVATCTIKRDNKEPVFRTFSKAKAEKAGLWGKTGPWSTYPDRMIVLRAFGFAARDACADILKGIITREEAEDIPNDNNKEKLESSNIPQINSQHIVPVSIYKTISDKLLELGDKKTIANIVVKLLQRYNVKNFRSLPEDKLVEFESKVKEEIDSINNMNDSMCRMQEESDIQDDANVV